MNKFKLVIFILTVLILGYNIYVIIENIINMPVDSLQTQNSIVNLIMISRINQIIAFIFSVILLVMGTGETKKEKLLFWVFIGINFFNAFGVFAVGKYLSMSSLAM